MKTRHLVTLDKALAKALYRFARQEQTTLGRAAATLMRMGWSALRQAQRSPGGGG